LIAIYPRSRDLPLPKLVGSVILASKPQASGKCLRYPLRSLLDHFPHPRLD